ncbi:ORF6C domain-containing protein [Weissella confusa]|uniref:ORF6C domain-containing protein n=1 Tax=Weissella confusa TaxID=1583 RepID=UPI002A766ABD|nr:ORF6C domain-containing protein [Weissella confusa]MDY2511634.1 ORF6C domain-containing protein [Weissella confusa]
MTNEVQVFNFEQMNVRTVEINDEVWFVAADVANALGLSNVSMSIKALDDDERSKFNLGRQGEVNVINEPGLYNFIGSSRKTEAKQFMRWVRHEVLPSIRKTGGYQAKPMTPMELLETQFEALKEVSEDQQELRGEFAELKEQFGLPNDLRKRFTKARNKRVVEVMGGYYGTAYNTKKLRNAVYRQLGNVIKDRFVINEFASLPMSKFDEAMRLTQNWQPDEVLTFAINGANEQALLEV